MNFCWSDLPAKPLLVMANILDHQKNLFPNHRFSLKNIFKDFTALFLRPLILFILRRQIFQGLTRPVFSGFASVIK